MNCPHCNERIEVTRKRQPLKRLPSPEGHSYKICWVAMVATLCEVCQTPIPVKLLEEHLAEELMISEGARAMSNRNKKRGFNKKTGPMVAQRTWDRRKAEL